MATTRTPKDLSKIGNRQQYGRPEELPDPTPPAKDKTPTQAKSAAPTKRRRPRQTPVTTGETARERARRLAVEQYGLEAKPAPMSAADRQALRRQKWAPLYVELTPENSAKLQAMAAAADSSVKELVNDWINGAAEPKL